MTSADGITWTAQTTPLGAWQSVCWSPSLGLFCAVGNDIFHNMAMTSPDGATWTSRSTPTTSNGRFITFVSVKWAAALGMFIACGGTGTSGDTCLITSSDGSTWTGQSLTTSQVGFKVVGWADSISTAIVLSGTGSGGAGTGVIQKSATGLSWTPENITTDVVFRNDCVDWSPSLTTFCVVGNCNTGTAGILTSSDGATWSQANPGNNGSWLSVYRSEALGLFVAVQTGSVTQQVMTSADAVTWTLRTANFGVAWASITGNG